MAPLLVTALVGIGVKIATDLLASGAKQMFKSGGPSFEATLDKARATSPAAFAGTPATRPALGMGLDDRSRVLAAATSEGPAMSPAQGFASYRRLEAVAVQAP